VPRKSEKNEVPKLPKLSGIGKGIVGEIIKNSEEERVKNKKPTKEKQMKTLYVSVEANRLLLYLYAEGEGKQNEIFEKAIKLYWVLKQALPEKDFRRLVRLAEKQDVEKIRARLKFE